MNITSIKRSETKGAAVKVYAKVQSRTRPAIEHNVLYIRTSRTRRFICSCENFLFSGFAHNRNCDHIKEVRKTYGKFAAKVQN
jgi:hypothetical protein